MDSHETWAPAVGGGGKRRRCPPPLKIMKIKDLQLIHPYMDFFSPCEGLSATCLLMEAIFHHVGAFLLLFSPYGRPIS